jgi:hypothetical protein
MHDKSLPIVGVCVNNPAPALSGNGAAIAPRPTSSGKLVSDGFQYFIGGMMPESASPMQPSATIIEIRPYPSKHSPELTGLARQKRGNLPTLCRA